MDAYPFEAVSRGLWWLVQMAVQTRCSGGVSDRLAGYMANSDDRRFRSVEKNGRRFQKSAGDSEVEVENQEGWAPAFRKKRDEEVS